jgi:hypothetical protein
LKTAARVYEELRRVAIEGYATGAEIPGRVAAEMFTQCSRKIGPAKYRLALLGRFENAETSGTGGAKIERQAKEIVDQFVGRSGHHAGKNMKSCVLGVGIWLSATARFELVGNQDVFKACGLARG